MVKVDLTAAKTLILGAYVPPFEERAPTTASRGILLSRTLFFLEEGLQIEELL